MRKVSSEYRPKDGTSSSDGRYDEITQTLKLSLRQGSFRAGELLQQIREEKLYGHWNTFADYVVGEIRISEVQAYRLMFAFGVVVLLKENNSPLPVNERQVRPLHALRKKPGNLLLAWDRACKKKQYGQPTYLDVQREVNALFQQEQNEDIERGYRIYRQHLQSMQTDLRRASDVLANGDLEVFLSRVDKKIVKRKQIIQQLLLKTRNRTRRPFSKTNGHGIDI
jgi:hypothetical protein